MSGISRNTSGAVLPPLAGEPAAIAEKIRRTLYLETGGKGQRRIAVAMSGGVDSSVMAALMKYWGFEVIGLTMRLHEGGHALPGGGDGSPAPNINDAAMLAERLGFEHHVLDYQDCFRAEVMEEFAAGYVRGETPNPCILCNRRMKFGYLAAAARRLGAQALLTGHYARISPLTPPASGEETGWGLFAGAERERDQSYFLFSIPREELSFLRFPLGAVGKGETRLLARALGLEVADKADSQDICFVPGGDYAALVGRLHPGALREGEIVHVDGRVLGRHKGIVNYTVGQRRGLGVAVGEPLFVVALDAEADRVIVGPREALAVRTVGLDETNWLGEGRFEELTAEGGLEVHVRLRSTMNMVPARLFADGDGRGHVVLENMEHGISPGQAGVFYDITQKGARVLGGGWIESAHGGSKDA